VLKTAKCCAAQMLVSAKHCYHTSRHFFATHLPLGVCSYAALWSAMNRWLSDP